MKCKESDVRMSPLLIIVAAIAFLMAVTVLATESAVFENERPQIDQLDVSPNVYLVYRLTKDDLMEEPARRATPAKRRRHQEVQDAYYQHRLDRSSNRARLDGILMDDPRFFKFICRTV